MKKIVLAALLAVLFVSVFAKDESTSVPSTLKSVTVYRTGAEMVHSTSAMLKQGDNTLIIENISNQLDINSIQVKAPASVTILGVEFSGNYLAPAEPSVREKTLEDSLESIDDNIDKVKLR